MKIDGSGAAGKLNDPYSIEVTGLNKTFDGYNALTNLNLKIKTGESLAIFGPNGAGKTTLIKILATIMSPSSGSVLVGGINIKDRPETAKRKIGVVSHNTFLYGNLSAYENLDYYRRLYDVPASRIAEVAAMVGMQSRLYSQISTLSRGMQQRFSIARALLHNPAIIMLDEPETGLDQQALSLLWSVLKGEGQEERTIVMASHNLERGLDAADRLIILSRGKIVYENAADNLSAVELRQVYQNYAVQTL
jgi:heme exporter protein A